MSTYNISSKNINRHKYLAFPCDAPNSSIPG